MTKPRLIIGIGNRFRRDDGIGPAVIEALEVKNTSGWRLLTLSGEGASLIEHWRGSESVVIVDAIRSGERAGTIESFDANEKPVPTGHFHYSSHAFGLAEAIEVSRALGELPRVHIVGVVGKDFSSGEELSPEVFAALPEVVRRIETMIADESEHA